MARRVALDHNFPKPVLAGVQRWIKDVEEVEFHFIRDLDPELAELQDHELVYALHDRDLTLLVTHNWKMENDARVLVALHLTRSTLLTLRRAGDDMIFATGVLLRDLVPVLRQDVPKGQVFRARPSRVTPRPAYRLLEQLGQPKGKTAQELIVEHRPAGH